MSIQTSVKYLSQGGEASWWVPFPYADGGQVGVTLVDGAGLERRLVYGSDYLVKDGFVICVVPAGFSLVIWLDAPLESALDAARSAQAASSLGTVQSSGQSSGQVTGYAAGQAGVARAASLASEDSGQSSGQAPVAAVADVERACEAAVSDATADIDSAVAGAKARIAAAADSAAAQVELQAGLCGCATARNGYLKLEQGLAAGSLLGLPEGLGYYFGHGQLLVWRNGLMLAPKLDWAEVGASEGEASGVIRILGNALAGDVFVFVVLPVTSAAAASASAMEAEAAYSNAAQCQANAEALVASAGRVFSQVEGYAGEARESACGVQEVLDAAQGLAASAWEALWHVSVHQRRPGIAAVRALSEICCAAPGLFIVNPHLTHAPTPFMGIWPARCEDDMKWDGVFFIGESWPEVVTMPPAPCFIRPPRPMPATGDSNDWLPCHHPHPMPKECDRCGKKDCCPAFSGQGAEEA